MAEAIYIRQGGLFAPTEAAASPWSSDLQHGGPPAGLLARTVEELAASSGMQVARLTVDLFRPVPLKPLEAVGRVVRTGKRIQAVDASLLSDGVEVCRASGLLLRPLPADASASEGGNPYPTIPGPEGIATGELQREGQRRVPRRPGFHTTIEVRWTTASDYPGPGAAWIRLPLPLVAGEEWTPVQRTAATCDFVNAFSNLGTRTGGNFINTDVTIYLHRPPAGEWIGMAVDRAVEPAGVGVAQALIYDERGAIGRAVQAILANEMT